MHKVRRGVGLTQAPPSLRSQMSRFTIVRLVVLTVVCGLLSSSCAVRGVRGRWNIDSPDVPAIGSYRFFRWFFIDSADAPHVKNPDPRNNAILFWETPLGCETRTGTLRNGVIAATGGPYSVVVRFHDRRRATVVLTYQDGTTREYPFRKTGKGSVLCE